jgi:ATP-binding cassette subfamily B protein
LSDESIRALISVVPQRIELLAGSVIENITVGDEHPDMARVLEATRGADLVDTIERLAAGFDSELGENGANLSGGERQRLAIARALYRDPEVLILDEATSSLDGHAIRRIRTLMHELRARGKTVIVVAHHLELVADVDLIVVMENGRIIEEGTHTDLLARRGVYQALWESRTLSRVA